MKWSLAALAVGGQRSTVCEEVHVAGLLILGWGALELLVKAGLILSSASHSISQSSNPFSRCCMK